MTFGGKLCVAVLGLTLLVGWQDAAAPSSHEAAARELMTVLDLPNMMTKAFDASIEAQVQVNPAMASFKDVLLDWGHKYITWEAVAPKMLQLYTDTYTEAELREMTVFYRTPTGLKAAQTLPELFEKGAKIGADIANEHKGELEKAIAARMSDGDH